MKILATILLTACIIDIVATFRIFQKGRKMFDIHILDMLELFKEAGYQVIMNTAASIFFIIYLIK